MAGNTRILTTGGDGMVGSQVDFGIRLGRSQLDILKPKSIEVAIKKYNPQVILHLAAMTNMLSCEQNPEEAYKTNVTGTRNIAIACRKNNIRLVYASTCAVFPGNKKDPYDENDKVGAVNVYGSSKLMGERVAKKILPDVLIIRTGWLFGGEKMTGNL